MHHIERSQSALYCGLTQSKNTDQQTNKTQRRDEKGGLFEGYYLEAFVLLRQEWW